mgnify:CR=1 FL=1
MFDESGVEILRLGEKFSFRYQQSGGWYPEHAYLPEGTWQQEGTDLTYSPQELTEQFDGATMAGTYILADYTREYIHNYDFEASYGTINTYSRSGSESYSSYCVNDELHLEDVYLNRHPVTTNEELDVYLDLRTEEARMAKSEDPYGALVKVLYYGFPNNGALSEDGNSLQEYFGVSDMRASQMTQYAVHYYSDGTEVNLDESVYGEEAIAYYQGLIGMNAEWNVQAMEVPENVRCKLYVFSNDEWDENGGHPHRTRSRCRQRHWSRRSIRRQIRHRIRIQHQNHSHSRKKRWRRLLTPMRWSMSVWPAHRHSF